MILGKSFTFNGQNSSDYNLMLVSFERESGFETPEIATELNLTTERTGNNPTVRLVNTQYSDVLKFQISCILNEDICPSKEISTAAFRNILKWLTTNKYTRLEIDEERFQNLYFNAIVTNITPYKIDDKLIGFVADFECDSPYGFTSKSIQKTVTTSLSFTINNDSDDLLNPDCYIKPVIKIIKTGTGAFSITNQTLGITTAFTKLMNTEELTMDCVNMIFNSSIQNRNMYSYFNRQWQKLAIGENAITVEGDGIITITYEVPRKVDM